MTTNAQQSQKSQADLIQAARALFGVHGYSKTSTPMIASAVGVSRGAIYHHFDDKQALFKAVVKAEYLSIESKIDIIPEDVVDPLEVLIEGGNQFIMAMSDPISRRILLLDGPAILGLEMMLSIDRETTTHSLNTGILHAQGMGRLPSSISASILTSLMSGAYDRAVLDCISDDKESEQATKQVIKSLWLGLSTLN